MDTIELKRRREVWSAMAELFLDTEVRWFAPSVALALANSNYSKQDLNQIWYHEAVPEYCKNLFGVGGEWIALDFDEAQMLKRMKARGWVARTFDQLLANLVSELWQATLALHSALATAEPSQRPELHTLWRAAAQIWTEDAAKEVDASDFAITALRTLQLSENACRESLENAFFPAYRNLLFGEDKAQLQKRKANVLVLLKWVGADLSSA